MKAKDGDNQSFTISGPRGPVGGQALFSLMGLGTIRSDLTDYSENNPIVLQEHGILCC